MSGLGTIVSASREVRGWLSHLNKVGKSTKVAAQEVTEDLSGNFGVLRSDGKPVNPKGAYLVLSCLDDPHALVALAAYASSIKDENPELALELRKVLLGQSNFKST